MNSDVPNSQNQVGASGRGTRWVPRVFRLKAEENLLCNQCEAEKLRNH